MKKTVTAAYPSTFPSAQPGSLRDIPRLPVLGWHAFSGLRAAPLPSAFDLPYRQFTASGSAAIVLALETLGVGRADRVLVPTYHCPNMIAPIAQAGAKPIFFPIDEAGSPRRSFLESVDLSGVRAMIAAHYFGLPQSFAWLREWCDEKGVALIEDCAHAFFGRREGVSVGSWGDVAIASLPKFFPVMEGGLLLSARRALPNFSLSRAGPGRALKTLWDSIEVGGSYSRFYGINTVLCTVSAMKKRLRHQSSSEDAAAVKPDEYEAPALGEFAYLKARRAPAAPAVWMAQAVHPARIVARRRYNYLRLVDLFAEMADARPLFPVLPDDAAPYVFPLFVEDARDVYQSLRAACVPIFRWDRLWPGTPRIEGDYGVEWADKVFQLACHQDLNEAHLARIAQALRTACAMR